MSWHQQPFSIFVAGGVNYGAQFADRDAEARCESAVRSKEYSGA